MNQLGKALWIVGTPYEQDPHELSIDNSVRENLSNRGRSLRENDWNAYLTQREAKLMSEDGSGSYTNAKFYLVQKRGEDIKILEYIDENFDPIDPRSGERYTRNKDWELENGINIPASHLNFVLSWMLNVEEDGCWRIEFPDDTVTRDSELALKREIFIRQRELDKSVAEAKRHENQANEQLVKNTELERTNREYACAMTRLANKNRNLEKDIYDLRINSRKHEIESKMWKTILVCGIEHIVEEFYVVPAWWREKDSGTQKVWDAVYVLINEDYDGKQPSLSGSPIECDKNVFVYWCRTRDDYDALVS